MILVDENIDDHITEAIRSINVDVYSVAKHTPGIKDEEIIELSRIPPRIILTEDKDFGEWVFSHGVKGVSVILLRYKFSDTKRMIEVLLDLLTKKIPDLIGKFTVVTNKQNQDQRLGEVNAMLRHSRRAIGRIHFFK